MTLPAPFRTLRGRLLGALGVAMGCLLGAQAFSELQTQRVGASLQVVDSAYLPLTRLAARMGPLTQPRDPAMAQTLAAAATVVEDAGRRTTIDEDRAALAAIEAGESQTAAECPICGARMPVHAIVSHVDTCIDAAQREVPEVWDAPGGSVQDAAATALGAPSSES